jgi:hypothetical protein
VGQASVRVELRIARHQISRSRVSGGASADARALWTGRDACPTKLGRGIRGGLTTDRDARDWDKVPALIEKLTGSHAQEIG